MQACALQPLRHDFWRKNSIAPESHQATPRWPKSLWTLGTTGLKNRWACALNMATVRNSKWRTTNHIFPRNWRPVYDRSHEFRMCILVKLWAQFLHSQASFFRRQSDVFYLNVFAIILLTVKKAARDEKTSAGLGFSRLLRSYMNC